MIMGAERKGQQSGRTGLLSLSELLPQIKDIITFPRERLPPLPENWESPYHGHTTDMCWTLQRLIDSDEIRFPGVEKWKTAATPT